MSNSIGNDPKKILLNFRILTLIYPINDDVDMATLLQELVDRNSGDFRRVEVPGTPFPLLPMDYPYTPSLAERLTVDRVATWRPLCFGSLVDFSKGIRKYDSERLTLLCC